MQNIDIRTMAKAKRVYHWELADYLGVSEQTFVRWLRKELPTEKKQEIFDAIDRIAAKEGK